MSFNFPDDVSKKMDTIKEESIQRKTEKKPFDSNPTLVQNQRKKEEKQPEQKKTMSSINPSDFEKLKEDLIYKVDSKFKELDEVIGNKIGELNDSINKFENLIEKLTTASTTYYEINTIIEKMEKNNKEYLLGIKEDIELKISKVQSTLNEESVKTEEFIEEYLSKNAKNKSSLSKKEVAKKEEKYDEEDEYEEDNNYKGSKKKDNDDEDDDVFVKKQEPQEKKGFLFKLFSKIGL